MFGVISNGFDYLSAQSFQSLLALFWFVLIFEIPRYGLSFIAAAFFARKAAPSIAAARSAGRISVIIAGHNEEHAIETCVLSLWEQSLIPAEIVVVSDGSSDRMRSKLGDLLRRGLIHKAHATDLRSGKSAATNMAKRLADGDIVINIDCDCSFDRDAFKNIVAPFADPRIGAVSGNILTRNYRETIISTFQAIEYLISISLGKQALDIIDQISCASGAFSAFRSEAMDEVGGLDSGGGEDLDITLRLRSAGWKIKFASDAICYTDTPSTLLALTKQRFRWERDAIRLRYRKHSNLLNPLSPNFRLSEAYHELEFLFFNVLASAVLPFYMLWLFAAYGDVALSVLISAQVGMALVDLVVFALAAHATPRANALALAPYVLGYSLFNGFVMRFVRLLAYLQEWIFQTSYRDTYVPDKVHNVRA
jgi:cellulose synthase/poly-beta-1,6-N-acetylglucosamine synthase-like glycosyltransferase